MPFINFAFIFIIKNQIDLFSFIDKSPFFIISLIIESYICKPIYLCVSLTGAVS